MAGAIVLGIDGSLRNTGWGVVELRHQYLVGRAGGVIVTKVVPKKKRHDYTMDRDAKDVRHIARELDQVLQAWKPAAVCLEGPAGSKGATANKCMGLSYATILTALYFHGVTPILVTAEAVKVAATGKKNASKADVITAVRDELGDRVAPFFNDHPEGRHEHLADAYATILASLDHPTIQLLRRQAADEVHP